MKYTFACKRVPLNDSIKEYAQKKISKLERYFREEDTTAFVTFSVEKDHLVLGGDHDPRRHHVAAGTDGGS